MDKLDKIMTAISMKKRLLEENGNTAKFIALNKVLYEELLGEFKDSLAFSELDYAFLSKIERLEKEIGRHDLKISIGKLFDLHIIISDILTEDEYIIL